MDNKVLPVLFVNKEDCTGCMACYSLCPVNAINPKLDEEGFQYPTIDESVCLGCGRCLEVCPEKRGKE